MSVCALTGQARTEISSLTCLPSLRASSEACEGSSRSKSSTEKAGAAAAPAAAAGVVASAAAAFFAAFDLLDLLRTIVLKGWRSSGRSDRGQLRPSPRVLALSSRATDAHLHQNDDLLTIPSPDGSPPHQASVGVALGARSPRPNELEQREWRLGGRAGGRADAHALPEQDRDGDSSQGAQSAQALRGSHPGLP